MLAALFVLLGVFGVFLNWPVIHKGFFASLTGGKVESQMVISILKEFSQGLQRADGMIVLAVAAIVVFTLFLHTTNGLIAFRSLLLGASSLFLIGEFFTALSQGAKLYSYAGLLYTMGFFTLAFFAAIFKMGSKKSLNSTLHGVPMTETQAFTQSIKETFDAASTILKLRLTPLDDISTDWRNGQSKTLDDPEIRIGRDPSWATLRIGNQWKAVSRRHGILKGIGKTLFYYPIAKKYAFAVNNKPRQMAAEIPNGATLTLVSGYGPKFKIEYSAQKLSTFHPKTFSRTAQIARDEFKKLQGTLKAFVIIAFLGIPIFGGFAKLQNSAWEGALNRIYEAKKRVEADLAQAQKDLAQKRALLRKYKREIEEISAQIKAKEDRIKELEEQGKAQSEEIEKLKQEIEELRQKAAQKSEDVREALEKIREIMDNLDSVLAEESIVFPILSFYEDKVGIGTGFFARGPSGQIYILTATHVVRGAKTTFIILDKKYVKELSRLKEVSQQELRRILQEVPTDKWQEIMNDETLKDGIVALRVSEAPERMKKYAMTISTELKPGDFIGIIGYPDGIRAHAEGTVLDVGDRMFTAALSSYHGFSGGPVFKIDLSGEVPNITIVGVVHGASGKIKRAKEFVSSFLRFPSGL